ncbi:MAG: hypothetical protein KIT73_12870 [Burkholderiales bacterium]|nr:hypothetical protein [Burkholderiales bacterium]
MPLPYAEPDRPAPLDADDHEWAEFNLPPDLQATMFLCRLQHSSPGSDTLR